MARARKVLPGPTGRGGASEPLRLAVGPYSSQGEASSTMDCQGRKLVESTTEGSRVVWGVGSRSSLCVERVLYELSNPHGYVVHAVLRSGKDHHPVLARVEVYPEWKGVSSSHPDLARTAAAAAREDPSSRIPIPTEVSPPIVRRGRRAPPQGSP